MGRLGRFVFLFTLMPKSEFTVSSIEAKCEPMKKWEGTFPSQIHLKSQIHLNYSVIVLRFSSPSQKENLLKTISIHVRWTFSIRIPSQILLKSLKIATATHKQAMTKLNKENKKKQYKAALDANLPALNANSHIKKKPYQKTSSAACRTRDMYNHYPKRE